MLALQAPTPGVVAQDPGEAAIQLTALIDHQKVATVQLINAEARLSTFKALTATVGPEERAAVVRQVKGDEGTVQGLKADLAATREKIQQIRANLATARKEAKPVVVVEPPLTIFGLRPVEFQGAAGFLILFPLALACARLLWRRSSRAAATTSLEGSAQLSRLENAVESIAIEVERIGEAQRFSAKLLAGREIEAGAVSPREVSRPQRRAATPIP